MCQIRLILCSATLEVLITSVPEAEAIETGELVRDIMLGYFSVDSTMNGEDQFSGGKGLMLDR